MLHVGITIVQPCAASSLTSVYPNRNSILPATIFSAIAFRLLLYIPCTLQRVSHGATMLFRRWAQFLGLSAWHHLASVKAGAIDEPRDHETYDSHLSDQGVFSGLCPDYTTYARHMQCVTSISDSFVRADM